MACLAVVSELNYQTRGRGAWVYLLLLLLSSFIGRNPMSDRTRIHVHSLKLNARDTQTVGPIL